MRDRGRIVLGLGVFLALAAYPAWRAIGSSRAETTRPALARAVGNAPCIEDTSWMKAHHQQLLNLWRTEAIRNGERTFIAPSGRRYQISLTGTCLHCHDNSAAFCDRCHTWSGVPTIRCWNCHQESEGGS